MNFIAKGGSRYFIEAHVRALTLASHTDPDSPLALDHHHLWHGITRKLNTCRTSDGLV